MLECVLQLLSSLNSAGLNPSQFIGHFTSFDHLVPLCSEFLISERKYIFDMYINTHKLTYINIRRIVIASRFDLPLGGIL